MFVVPLLFPLGQKDLSLLLSGVSTPGIAHSRNLISIYQQVIGSNPLLESFWTRHSELGIKAPLLDMIFRIYVHLYCHPPRLTVRASKSHPAPPQEVLSTQPPGLQDCWPQGFMELSSRVDGPYFQPRVCASAPLCLPPFSPAASPPSSFSAAFP